MTIAKAQAWSVGDRIVVRGLEGWAAPVAKTPLTIPGRAGGFAVLFRFGAVAAVGLSDGEVRDLLDQIARLATDAREAPCSEESVLEIDPGAPEGIDLEGRISLRELTVGRAQVVASVLAKSAVLDEYENEVAPIFERIEPFSTELRGGRVSRGGQVLLRELGAVLLTRSRMVGRAGIGDKPELTWDEPALDRLYEQLAVEYELRDREQAVAKKLDAVSQAAATYLDVLSDRRTLRVEWYIVLLIVIEILLFAYELFWRSGPR